MLQFMESVLHLDQVPKTLVYAFFAQISSISFSYEETIYMGSTRSDSVRFMIKEKPTL